MTKFAEELKTIFAAITYQINTLKSLPTQKDSPKPPEPTTVVTSNTRTTPLNGIQSTRICGTWNLKHGIRSPRLYELLIKT